MRGVRLKRNDVATASTTVTGLITPKIENLTVGPVPTDTTNIVIARPNDLGITDKFNALLSEYQAEMVRLPSTGNCASSITAKIPRELIQSLYDMLNVNNNGCYQETQTFLQMLVSYLSSSTEAYINIPRNFWGQLGKVFTELNVSEAKLNMYAALARSMCSSISCDAQALPSNNMLISTLESVSELEVATTDKPLDEDFLTNYPEMVLDQPEPNEVLTGVIESIPTTIGESSANPPTNMIDLTASDASENIQIHDLDDEKKIEAQAYEGLKDLFSVQTLGIPISKLKIINNGKVMSTGLVPITYVVSATYDGSGSTPAVKTTTATTEVYSATEVDVSDVDENKSLMEQDWSVVPSTTDRNADGTVNYIDIMTLIQRPGKKRVLFPEETTFKGAMTRKVYTGAQVMGLATSLGGLWNKVVSMKLPSMAHVQTGTSILAAGLGAAGTIFGSAGLVKSSSIVGSIANGLGSFTANLKPTNGLTPEPKASIPKNALCVVPGVIEAGKSIYEGDSINAQHQRIKLHGIRNAVENGYIMPSTELMSRNRIRRIGSTFF